jgi:hypothetical protein
MAPDIDQSLPLISQSRQPITREEHASRLSDLIIDEIVYAFGGKRNGWLQRLTTPLLRIPARHFGRIAADFYYEVNQLGISAGASATLPRFNHQLHTRGIEMIPEQGPLLVVSNHPGGLDSLGIVSCMPRNDLKALVTDVKFLRQLDHEDRYFYFVDFKATGGMLALREAIEHLKSGGALLLFAHGEVEPEPESFPKAREEITRWSPSIEIMLRKVPETRLQILTLSGAVQARFLNNPITRLRREAARRQKLAEFLQVITAMFFPKIKPIQLHVTVGAPLATSRLGDGRWMPEIIQRAQVQFDDHLRWVKSISPKT